MSSLDLARIMLGHWPEILLTLIIARLTWNKWGHGINKIPGPWLAAYTDLWRLAVVWGRHPEVYHIGLHRKYGDIVRLGAKAVSVTSMDAVKKIYALNSGFVKSEFYPVQQTISKGKRLYTLFTSTDEKFHAKLRRAVANAYAMSSLVQFEPLVDSTIEVFLDQLESRFGSKPGEEGVCDFGVWLQYYAFDVIGELSFSKRLGFIEEGRDVDGIIANLEGLLNYVSVIGQMPILDRLLVKNPIRLWCSDHGLLNTNTAVVNFAKERIAGRLNPEDSSTKTLNSSSVKRRDFLSRFLEAKEKDPIFIDDQRVLALTVANMFAGSDTTAITLRAIFYFLLKNPTKHQKLMEEFKNAEASGRVSSSNSIVAWEEARDLPYLAACVQESMRLHPAAGLTLERIVPPQGIELCGQFLPGGTIVGCSAWALHAKESIFGAHTDEFVPERWIDASGDRQIEMNNALFSFGMGSRTCIGKNISLLEMFKLIPTLFRRFEISLANPNKEWKLHNAWFVKQSEFHIRLRRKQGATNSND